MQTYYKTLSETLILRNEHHKLKKILTHSSFYNKENHKEDTASKYIFLGMYAFKGKVAEILCKYVPLNGKQLQHYLGNIFKQSQLEKIYKHYHLERGVRYGKNINIEEKHHLFVYAILGFIYSYADEKQLQKIIYNNFIKETAFLMPDKSIMQKDIWAQCIYICRMYYNQKPEISIEKNENGIFYCCVSIGQEIIGTKESKNKQYAKKTAAKIALKKIADDINQEWIENPLKQEQDRRIKKQKAEKEAKLKAIQLKEYKEKQKKRAEEIAKRKNERKKIAIEKDKQRRIAKEKSRKRIEEIEEIRKKQKTAIANLSVAKRRHMQDKGWLEKGVP